MNDLPLISVIIPVFNASDFISAAIESVLSQTWKNREIIIVDDGSTDRSLEVVRQFQNDVQLLQTPHAGPSVARNSGIEASHGEYLVFLDADDLILSEKLTSQAKFLNSHLQIGVVYSGGYRLRKSKDGIEVKENFENIGMLNPNLGAPDISLHALVTQNAFPIHCAMVRREAVLACGGFDNTLYGLEDWDLWLRVAVNHTFEYLPGEVAVYRLVPGSISYQQKKQEIAYRNICKKIENAGWFRHLSSREQARFYLDWAIQELSFGSTNLARIRLQQSRNIAHYYLPALLYSAAVAMLGNRASIIYKLKRHIFGPRLL
jgi:glycosyltransferase involved in cell wall biosynthesis